MRSDLRFGAWGLGAAGLGNLYGVVSDETARAAVDRAWAVGVRLFDTAPFYGFGLSERRLGDALRERPRDEYLLSTKVGRLLKPAAEAREKFGFLSPMPFDPVFDYSYDGVMRSFEDSLQRLGLSRIDILLMHDIGAVTHGEDAERQFAAAMDGGYRALDDLRSQGVVAAIGLGVNETAVCRAAMARGDWDVFLVAGRYTLLSQAEEGGFFEHARAKGAHVLAAGVYNSGILASDLRGGGAYYDYAPAPAPILERARRIQAICDRHDTPLGAAALQFARAHPAVSAVLVGAPSGDQVEETAARAARPIPSALWRDLREAGLIAADAATPA